MDRTFIWRGGETTETTVDGYKFNNWPDTLWLALTRRQTIELAHRLIEGVLNNPSGGDHDMMPVLGQSGEFKEKD